MTNGLQMQVSLDLMLGSIGGVDADLSNTNSLSLILPSNVSFTSASGTFLTQQAASTPEPSTLLLFGVGLLGLGWFDRRKLLISVERKSLLRNG